MHEMPSVSRMREIRTSGLMREEGRLIAFLLYSTASVRDSTAHWIRALMVASLAEDAKLWTNARLTWVRLARWYS